MRRLVTFNHPIDPSGMASFTTISEILTESQPACQPSCADGVLLGGLLGKAVSVVFRRLGFGGLRLSVPFPLSLKRRSLKCESRRCFVV